MQKSYKMEGKAQIVGKIVVLKVVKEVNSLF